MSHLNTMTTTMSDKEMLIRALCKHMHLNRNQIEVHDKAARIHGYHSEDVFLGHVIVRKENAGIPSDIGWELKGEAFIGHVDSYDYSGSAWLGQGGGHGIILDNKWNMGLQQTYNHEVIKQGLKDKGIAFKEATSPDGYPILMYEHPEEARGITL
jgi:hypothetical protein